MQINCLTDTSFLTGLDGHNHEQRSSYSQAFGETFKQQGFPFEDGDGRLTATLTRRQQHSGFSLLD